MIVCAYNEEALLTGCLHSLLAQNRPPDEILVVNNASTDQTGAVARGDVLAYVDADCRPPIFWLERVERHFQEHPSLAGLTGPYRFYDWDWLGRTLIRAYDLLVAPPTHVIVHHLLQIGAIFYGGNFAVARIALERTGGFDRAIEFHGEDTNLGRRLTAVGLVHVQHAGRRPTATICSR